MKRLALLFFLLAFTANADITSNLQVHIDFEDRYADQSSVGRTVNKDGTLNYVTGKVGTKAGSFDTGAYLTIYDSPGGLEGVADFTLSAWIKPDDTTSNLDNLVLKPSGYKIRRKDTANGSSWTSYIFDSEGHRQDPVSANNVGASTDWNHICMTVYLSGAGTTIKYYINGSLAQTITDPASWTDLIASGDNCTVGATTADFDDIRMYDRALSADDVTELYNLGSSATPTPTSTFTPTPTNTVPTPTPTVPTPTPTVTETPIVIKVLGADSIIIQRVFKR